LNDSVSKKLSPYLYTRHEGTQQFIELKMLFKMNLVEITENA